MTAQKITSISFLDLLLVLLERKKLIIVVMGFVAIASVVGTGFLPQEYQASATILPPKTQMPGGLGGVLDNLPVAGMLRSLDIFGGSDNDQFVSILESGRLAARVIREFDLAERYKFSRRKHYYAEDLAREYNRHYSMKETDLGNIAVSFIDKDPVFAAEVVSFIVAQLDSINYEIAKTSARNSRVFFEERLRVVKRDLDSAHARFNRFRLENRYLDLEEQVKGTIEALSRIEAERMALDIKIQQLRNRFGSGNNRVKELEQDRAVVAGRIRHYMEQGSGELIVALDKTPALGVEYAHNYRDVKIQETLYTYLVQMHEQSRFMEVNNTPVVQVLDPAAPPTKKMRPKRGAICIVVFSLTFFLLASVIVGLNWLRTQREANTDLYAKLREVYRHLQFRK